MSPNVPVEYKGLFHGNNYIVNVRGREACVPIVAVILWVLLRTGLSLKSDMS